MFLEGTGGLRFFRAQERDFATLNLMLIAAVLVMQILSRIEQGKPTTSHILVLSVGLFAQTAQLFWLANEGPELSPAKRRFLPFWIIGLNSALALTLSSLEIGGDTAYYALMLLPILESAFRLTLAWTAAVVALADLICFTGAYGLKFDEYLEASASTIVFTVMGVLVWLLVDGLRKGEAGFISNLKELERARERLLAEEKLAAVGRLARALAHEIRNPVAMISSSLATALRADQLESERQTMFDIAAKEAIRLERLTTDFLLYARPRVAQLAPNQFADTLNYVAAVARAHAANVGVEIETAVDNDLVGDFDASQIQQALLNLVLNAIDACRRGQTVRLAAELNDRGTVRIDVTDPAGQIAAASVERIFEPLFTTKPGGSGLGLAIARNIARAHGGDIWLRINEPNLVCFSIELPLRNSTQPTNETLS